MTLINARTHDEMHYWACRLLAYACLRWRARRMRIGTDGTQGVSPGLEKCQLLVYFKPLISLHFKLLTTHFSY